METVYISGKTCPNIPSFQFKITFQDQLEIQMNNENQTLNGYLKNIELPYNEARLFLEQFGEKMEDGSWNVNADKIPPSRLLLFLTEYVCVPYTTKWLLQDVKNGCKKEEKIPEESSQ